MKLQESGENYLENILILEQRQGRVRSVDLAEEMNFSKPSISRAVHLLEDGAYIKIDNDGSLLLTETGRKVAETIYERHIFITEFLMSLGVPEHSAAEDACRIEHVISAESFEALKRGFRNCPPNCPRANRDQLFDSTRKVISERTEKD